MVTNSLQVADVLHAENRPDLTVVITGGVRTPSDALVGPIAERTLRTLHVDVLFMGVHGMTEDAGFTTPNPLEAETDKALIASASRFVVVADHTKWGVRGLVSIASLSDADVLVTDDGLPADALALLAESIPELVVAPLRRRRNGQARGAERRDASPPHDGRDDRPEASRLLEDVHTGLRTYVVGSRQSRPNLPGRRLPLLPGRARGARGLRRPLVPQPLAGDCPTTAARSCSTRPSTTRRSGRSGCREHGRWSISGRSARRRSGRGPTSSTCSCSRTAAPRSAPRSPTRTGRSTPSTSCRSCRSGSSSAASRFDDPGDRLVATGPGWRAWVPEAPIFPYALRLVPDAPVPDLPSLDDAGRNGLAVLLVDVLQALDRLFDAQTPYMLWIHQRPFDGRDWPQARLHVEIVTPWRAPGVPRFVAAGELGSGVYFNPVAPEAAAQSLREARA